jgi:tRNA U34 5-methylaminomethyl-2-thiouridine-forming methyltransferase MnmC
MSSLRLVITGDGSHTLYNTQLDETYHSRNGALTESRHIFLDQGLAYYLRKNPRCTKVRIFEMGLGTGLNALLALQWAIENQVRVEYHAVDTTPLDMDMIQQLNYPEVMKWPQGRTFLDRLHALEWELRHDLHPHFSIKKTDTSIEKYQAETEAYQVIFYDAFAPSKQINVWDPFLLEKMYADLSAGGIMTTYCARGQFKRDLRSIGFSVETLPGPPGKHEMVRAVKPDRKFL